ncbi:MAG TPA: hypothetical protein EYP21_07525 [Syntrophaceae bacterium]|nr:hypothetical protein [Syntrophaceae bacterium]
MKPAIIPYYQQIKMDGGQIVVVVKTDRGISKPYYVEREERNIYSGCHWSIAIRHWIRLFAIC